MKTDTLILVVEDDESLRTALCETLELAGYKTVQADCGASALKQLPGAGASMVISDVQMPGMDGHEFLARVKSLYPSLPVVLMTAFGSVDRAVEALHQGAADYICKPFEAAVLIEAVDRLVVEPQNEGAMVMEDRKSQSMAELAMRVAKSDASVMISGESGVGKEVFARLIHDNSSRKHKPFVAINCAAIPENMLESILFGYEKGAFTGAHMSRAGKFEQANGGTLLLDEISEMDMLLQAKLLRVVQEREVERLGGKQAIALDVRILATTNRDLAADVAAGKFREDLFYRLNVFPLQVPPLRERRGDIIPLCRSFITKLAPGEGITLDAAAVKLLLNYPWPGNVRELQNVVQRAIILKSGRTIEEGAILFETGALQAALSSTETATEQQPEPGLPVLADDLKCRELELIIETLSAEKGSRKQTAAKLGISPRTLRYKLARFRDAGVNIPQMHGVGAA